MSLLFHVVCRNNHSWIPTTALTSESDLVWFVLFVIVHVPARCKKRYRVRESYFFMFFFFVLWAITLCFLCPLFALQWKVRRFHIIPRCSPLTEVFYSQTQNSRFSVACTIEPLNLSMLSFRPMSQLGINLINFLQLWITNEWRRYSIALLTFDKQYCNIIWRQG